jgi:translocation and assembly module TamB
LRPLAGVSEAEPRICMKGKAIIARAIRVLVVIVLLAVAGVLLFRTRAFQRFLLGRVEQAASAALGTQVHVDGLDLRLSDLSADLRGITIRGNQANMREPLLYVRHLELNFKIISVLRLQWNLNSVIIDHPVVHIVAGENGKTNIPQKSSSSRKSVFDLAVAHAVIRGGEVYYNDAGRALSADLHDLQFQARYDSSAEGRYYGKLEYRQGKLRLGQYNAIPHDLRASFSATRAELALNPLVLASGPSQLELVASLQDYASPRVTGQYRATLVTDDLRRMLNSPALPSGTLKLAGMVEYEHVAGRPAMESVTLAGDLNSDVVKVQNPRFRGAIRDIRAGYTIANGNAQVPKLRARLLGGVLEGNLTIRDLAGQAQSRMQATLNGISLSELEPLAPAQAIKDVRLTGQMDGKLDATWVRSMQDLVANLDVSIGGEANSRAATQATAPANVPLTGFIHGSYTAAREQVTLSNSSLRTRQTSIQVNGTLSRQSSLQIHAQSGDLHELETIASIFSTPGDGRPVGSLALSGSASFTGEMRGSTTSPTLSGQLTGRNVHLKGSSWRSVRANIRAGPEEVVLHELHLEPEAQGQIELSGQASLTHWSYFPENAFALAIKASQLSAADIAKVAGIRAPVSGVVNANISLHGSQLNPVGQGRVFLSKAAVAGEAVQQADLQFRGTGDSVTGTLEVHLLPGAARGEFTYYPRQSGYQVMLQATDLQLDRFNTNRVKKLGLAGALNVRATGRGTLEDPGLEATVTVPQLRVQDTDIREFKLQASVNNHVATVDLSSQAAITGVQAHGTVELQGGYNADLKIDTGTIRLQTLAAIYAPAQAGDISGQTELHATVHGPLKNKQLLQARASIPVLRARYKTIDLAAVRPVQIDYTSGMFEVQRFEIEGTDTKLELEGRIPTNRQAPASVRLLGNVNLSLLHVLGPGIRSSGKLQVNVNSFGSIAAPGLQGEIRIMDASVLADGAPLGLRNGNGVLTLKNDRIAIDSFQAEVGGGTVTARGGMGLSPQVHFDLALSGNGIHLLYPEGVRSSFETSLTLSGNLQEAFLRGQANIDQISLTRDFDLSRVAEEYSGNAATASSGFTNQIHLNVSLRTTSEVNLSGRTLSLQGGANLQLQGTAAQPVAVGRVDIAGGDVIFLSNRYEITGGTVQFTNPTRTEPVLNLEATTTINEYNISLRLEGPLDRLRTNYSSDPSLPPADIINLIAFGTTTETASASASTSQFGGLGAESVLASGISSQVAGRVEKLTGISQLSIDPILGADQGDPGARIVVRQRVTSKLFVTFSAGTVTSTLNQVIQVRYQLNSRWSIAADVDQNGGFGFDARVHKEF